jgi:hypothetical protein
LRRFLEMRLLKVDLSGPRRRLWLQWELLSRGRDVAVHPPDGLVVDERLDAGRPVQRDAVVQSTVLLDVGEEAARDGRLAREHQVLDRVVQDLRLLAQRKVSACQGGAVLAEGDVEDASPDPDHEARDDDEVHLQRDGECAAHGPYLCRATVRDVL